MQVTTAIALDKRRKRKKTSGLPVVIRVTYNRVPSLFPTGNDLTEEDFGKLFSPRIRPELVQIRASVEKEHARVKNIIKKLNPFSFDDFRLEFYKDKTPRKRKNERNETPKSGKILLPLESMPDENLVEKNPVQVKSRSENHLKFAEKKIVGKTKFRNQYGGRKYPEKLSEINYASLGEVAKVYGEYIKELEIDERTGLIKNHFNSLMSLLNYKKKLRFRDITPTFLKQYQRWMTDRDRTESTVGIYVRPLRTIYNVAIGKKIINEKHYPFGKGKYKIPGGRNIKKAIKPSGLKKLYEHKPTRNPLAETMCLDFFFFMVFGSGLNMKDIALLKFKNIDGNYLRIYRAKTYLTTASDRRLISIFINEDMWRIIKRWGNSPTDPNNYIFPILKEGISHYQKRELVQRVIKRVNKWMNKIAKEEEVENYKGTQSGRHTFATLLKNAGVSKEFIRGQLGHIDPKSIDNYLDSFEDEANENFTSHLTDFKNIPDQNKAQNVA
jgi:integrase/recombinase XerD